MATGRGPDPAGRPVRRGPVAPLPGPGEGGGAGESPRGGPGRGGAAMALPVKMFSLTVKVVAKPLANSFQRAVLANPGARRRMIDLAQLLHRMDVWLTRGAEGKEGNKYFVGKLKDEDAMKLASKFASEGFIYAVGTGLLVWEMNQSKVRDQRKAEQAEARRKAKLEAAARERERLDAALLEVVRRQDALRRRVEEMEGGRRRPRGGGLRAWFEPS